jgi:tetratricopeptide (TPR) repeat protein
MTVRAALVAAMLAAAPSHVVAGVDDAIPSKARALADTGRIAHDRGDYPRAIAAFKEAYVIAPAPALLFNLAQSYRLQGNCEDASLMYRRYLGTGPSDEGRALAETHLATVERCIYKRSLNIPMDDSVAYLRVPTPPELGVVDPAVRERPPGQLHKQVGLGLTLGGAAALGIAAYYGARAHSASEDVERAFARGAKWKEIAARHAEGQRAETGATLFGIGGGIAVVTGVTLMIVGKKRAAPIEITPSAKGARVSVAWQF